MKALTVQNGVFELADLPAPKPGRGQVVLEVLRCGICGSDLHARHHADQLADDAALVGVLSMMRADHKVVMGHEFIGEIAEYGKGTRKRWKPGTRVVAMPIRRNEGLAHPTGFSELAPGAYAEQVVAEESMCFTVPNGLSTEEAALTEPMAVGWHAVRRSGVGKGDTAIVIGCGPIGLAVIGMLKAKGVRHIVASDFSPARRALAEKMGAHVVVHPGETSPYDDLEDRGHLVSGEALFDLGISAMSLMRRSPLPWEPMFRAAELAGQVDAKSAVIFECVGVPGMIDNIIAAAPLRSRVIVVGVCMDFDKFRPSLAINKEIDIRFVLGYLPIEFRDTLHMLADGKVDVRPLITGTVGLGGVDAAFTALGSPERHAKILIDPKQVGGTDV
ncbi:zinc-binding dehydrogenase [Smaragdicoccus niigatensis]|uniref:zinc-binding dehydrogenase n=1 Tax=Smaragdicoccus niigatensis TaxID=359359 RepID=UPI000382586F|nr:zinc-binding dehydrogenase [Smaragdicoccus niigatensis]